MNRRDRHKAARMFAKAFRELPLPPEWVRGLREFTRLLRRRKGKR